MCPARHLSASLVVSLLLKGFGGSSKSLAPLLFCCSPTQKTNYSFHKLEQAAAFFFLSHIGLEPNKQPANLSPGRRPRTKYIVVVRPLSPFVRHPPYLSPSPLGEIVVVFRLIMIPRQALGRGVFLRKKCETDFCLVVSSADCCGATGVLLPKRPRGVER